MLTHNFHFCFVLFSFKNENGHSDIIQTSLIEYKLAIQVHGSGSGIIIGVRVPDRRDVGLGGILRRTGVVRHRVPPRNVNRNYRSHTRNWNRNHMRNRNWWSIPVCISRNWRWLLYVYYTSWWICWIRGIRGGCFIRLIGWIG